MDDATLTTTEHEKIRVERPMNIDVDFVEESISRFQSSVYLENEEIFKLVQEIIPTYIRK